MQIKHYLHKTPLSILKKLIFTLKMDTIFWVCVKLMQVMSNLLGISYQQLNVLLFVIIHPAITILLFLKYKKYKRLWEEKQSQIGQG